MVKQKTDARLKSAEGLLNNAKDEIFFVKTPLKADFFEVIAEAIEKIEEARKILKDI